MSDTLLLELGTEELPPRALRSLSQALADGTARGLADAGLTPGAVTAYATPRRLAVSIDAVQAKAPDRVVDRLGPAVAQAFDADGEPTGAATGFARSCGVAVEALEQRETEKGLRLAYQATEPGRPLTDIVPALLADVLKSLPTPKRMRWGSQRETFVRPVHWIVALHGDTVIDLEQFGCRADRLTHGHRFHCAQALSLEHAEGYASKLRAVGYVEPDFERRRALIEQQVQAAAAAANGRALLDPALLDEVTALVEWPVALAGSFDERFLVLPREALIATLQGHQRYFPLVGEDGALRAGFVTVANIESRNPDAVITGNERVVKPRLADALFFHEADRRRGLEPLAAGLARVSFQRDLGSLADKSARVTALSRYLAQRLDQPADAVTRAATLAKADLLTDMVGEFPELQGTMGRYYALDAGEPAAVADAIEAQYAPRGAGAAIPDAITGQMLALAEKLDTLAGLFAAGKPPGGDKDPFALRRAALGVLRILIEGKLALALPALLDQALAEQPLAVDRDTVAAALVDFHTERLRAYLADAGIGAQVFDAVAATGVEQPLDFQRRATAVAAFLDDPAARALGAAHKRIRNILKKNPDAADAIDAACLQAPAEQQLAGALAELEQALPTHLQQQDYRGALHRLAQLQAPVDAFFDEVMVMSDDDRLRANRLALLAALDRACRQVADISRLSVE